MNYYASLISGRRVALLSGPYTDHADALAAVAPARAIVLRTNPDTWFDQFGTVSANTDRPGVLERAGYVVAREMS